MTDKLKSRRLICSFYNRPVNQSVLTFRFKITEAYSFTFPPPFLHMWLRAGTKFNSRLSVALSAIILSAWGHCLVLARWCNFLHKQLQLPLQGPYQLSLSCECPSGTFVLPSHNTGLNYEFWSTLDCCMKHICFLGFFQQILFGVRKFDINRTGYWRAVDWDYSPVTLVTLTHGTD